MTAKNKTVFIETSYSVAVNEEKEVLFVISPRDNEPDGAPPYILYDGGEHALFYRNTNKIIVLDYLDSFVRSALSQASKVLLAEVEREPSVDIETDMTGEEKVIREYECAVKQTPKLPQKHLSKLSSPEQLIKDAENILSEALKDIAE